MPKPIPLPCPACGGTLRRSHRTAWERLLSLVVPVVRLRCTNPECGWHGLRRRNIYEITYEAQRQQETFVARLEETFPDARPKSLQVRLQEFPDLRARVEFLLAMLEQAKASDREQAAALEAAMLEGIRKLEYNLLLAMARSREEDPNADPDERPWWQQRQTSVQSLVNPRPESPAAAPVPPAEIPNDDRATF